MTSRDPHAIIVRDKETYVYDPDLVNAQVNKAKEWAIKTDGKVQEEGEEVDWSSKHYAGEAKASELSASASATSAATSASAATTQAGIATSQASAATTKASEASVSASNAHTYETGAQGYASQASASATSASQSATTASGHATNAANSATESATQAGLATTAKNDAIAAKNTAAQKATDAANSAIDSANSATEAAGHVTEAEAQVALAKQWAIGDPEEPDEGSAKYWAQQSHAGQVQADWTETDEEEKSFIQNKPQIINNTTSTSTTDILAANQGKVLQEQVNNLKNIGRFCSIWNASTGLATTEPPETPYIYKNGDYFRIGVAGNRVPTGSQYVQGAYDTIQGTTEIGDVWYYDGTGWMRQASSGGGTVQDVQVGGTSVLSGGIANVENASTSEIDAKTASNKVITPANLDYAVKKGLTDNSITLTAQEKEAVQNWLDISSTIIRRW